MEYVFFPQSECEARRLVRWYIGMDEVKSEVRMHGFYVSRD